MTRLEALRQKVMCDWGWHEYTYADLSITDQMDINKEIETRESEAKRLRLLNEAEEILNAERF